MTDLEKLLAEVTPGEWVADGNGILLTNRGESYVALCIRSGTRNHDEAEANARLIALAPTLVRKVIAAERLAEALRRASAFIVQEYGDAKAQAMEGELLSKNARSVHSDVCAAIAAWEAAQ